MNKNKFTIIGIILTTVILAGVAIFTAMRLYQTRDTAVAPNAPSSAPFAKMVEGVSCNINSNPDTCPSGYKCTSDGEGTTGLGVCIQQLGCSLSFTVNIATATPTATATGTATATATATATSVPQCNSACSSTSNCPSGLTCYKPNGATAGNCRNTSCTTASNCFCATSTPTATATATSTSVATVTPTATSAPQCNYACTSNSNCPSSMICYIPSGSTAGNCRNTQCLSETDCLCAVATSTATSQPTLPVVGTSWPTLVGTGFGVLVILGSLLLAL